MKIAMLGCGSLGSTFGGVLTEAGFDVTLVNRNNDHIAAMIDKGLTLIEDAKERIVEVKVATDPQEVGPVELIIVLVKSSFTRAAIEGAKAMIGRNTLAMSLQNGLGNEEILVEFLGKGRVLGGKTYVGGQMTEPGKVRVGVKGKLTLLGELDGRITARAKQISGIFNRAGLETRVISDIQSLIWQKLLVNVSTGAICGLTRLPYGKLLQVKEAVDCATAAVAEAIDVARAAGVDLEVNNPREILDKAVEGLPFDFKPSIMQDLERGMPTEIDFINGAVVREGEKYGVATPVNRTLVAGIKGLEFAFNKELKG
jgi:2-dehydropantoate 2-reductase